MWAIAVEELRKYYGSVRAVDGLSFKVFRGEVFGLLGPNGAGKTTTVETIIGLVKRDQGRISVLDLDPLAEPRLVKSRIGVQLQMAHFFPRLTVLETIRLFGSFYPKRRPEEEVLSLIGLQEKARTLVDKLSGGQLKRLSVGLALVGDVEVVFLDEPTSGLDPQSRRSLWEVIFALKKEGKTVFLTTHYLDEAQRLCDRVAIIDQGKIIALGRPRDLILKHFQEKAVEIPRSEVQDMTLLSHLASITRMSADDEKVTLYTLDLAQVFADLNRLAKEGGVTLHNITVREATLEDVFLKLTGRRIRD